MKNQAQHKTQEFLNISIAFLNTLIKFLPRRYLRNVQHFKKRV